MTAFVACRYWPRGGRAYVAAVLFPVGVALTGAIIVNRYDAAVALLIAVFLLCLSARWFTAAAFVLGMGFALKLTPAALLPLVLLLAGPPARWAWPLVAFVAAAAAPFLPYLFSSSSGLWYVFQYHLERPLQIESVLGTPMLFGKLLGADWATWAHSHGSHSLVAPGVGLAADASGGLTLLAVAAVYLARGWRRRRLRAAPADQAHRRARPDPRAHDLRQGALAAVLHLDPAGVGAGRRARPLRSPSSAASRSRSPRPSSRRSTGTCSTWSRHRWRSSSRATRCCWRRSRSRCGGCGGHHGASPDKSISANLHTWKYRAVGPDAGMPPYHGPAEAVPVARAIHGVWVIGEDDVGTDEDVILDGHQSQEAPGVDPHAVADVVAELEHRVGADGDVVPDLVVFADARPPGRSAGRRR